MYFLVPVEIRLNTCSFIFNIPYADRTNVLSRIRSIRALQIKLHMLSFISGYEITYPRVDLRHSRCIRQILIVSSASDCFVYPNNSTP